MKRLFRERFPIRRMKLIDSYGADDHRSMNADNTSAFNCRFVAGTNRWSMHAYGKAIDLNPIENPYVPRRSRLTARRAALRRPLPRRQGHGPRRRPRRPRLPPQGRLEVGRQLARAPRLPALLRQRRVTALRALGEGVEEALVLLAGRRS